MAFTDVIDDYTTGVTGILTDGDGQRVNYTVTDGAPNRNDAHHGDNSASVASDGNDTLTVTFDDPVLGVSVAFYGGDNDEAYFVIVNGVQVDLNTLIANGDATFTNIGTTSSHVVNSDGSVSGDVFTDGSIGQLTLFIPVTSIGVVGAGTGDLSGSDGIEIGLDSAAFEVICFAQGTDIMTPTGGRRIEELKVGDHVTTLDNGSQPILWVGRRRFNTHILEKNHYLRPVRIQADALGPGVPSRDLWVSRQHRMLISSNIAKRMFGRKDVLIPAIKLINFPNIAVDDSICEIEYIHVLLSTHEIIQADGAPTESLFTGPDGLKAMSPEARAEVLAIFPKDQWEKQTQSFARPVPSGRDQKQFLKCLKNNLAL
jgi:hypothetical protein